MGGVKGLRLAGEDSQRTNAGSIAILGESAKVL